MSYVIPPGPRQSNFNANENRRQDVENSGTPSVASILEPGRLSEV
jgi:hypothetical protein